MNEPQNNPVPPQPQNGPQQGPAAPQQHAAGPQQGYGPQGQGYQNQQGGYGHPPAPGNGPPPWAHQGCQHGSGGYQDQYQGGYGHPPAPGNNPPWAHQDRHQGGHPAYYGPPPVQPPSHPGYGIHPRHYAPAYSAPPGYYAQAGYAPYPHHDSGLGSFFNFRDERFVKGAITGAALTFLLTSDTVQKNGIKSLVKLWSLFQGGIEEIKERFKDAEAEVKTESQPSK